MPERNTEPNGSYTVSDEGLSLIEFAASYTASTLKKSSSANSMERIIRKVDLLLDQKIADVPRWTETVAAGSLRLLRLAAKLLS